MMACGAGNTSVMVGFSWSSYGGLSAEVPAEAPAEQCWLIPTLWLECGPLSHTGFANNCNS